MEEIPLFGYVWNGFYSRKYVIENNIRFNTAYTVNGQWSLAAPGMVFISNTNKYYSQVTNPANYRYVPQSEADASGASRAARGNQYARP